MEGGRGVTACLSWAQVSTCPQFFQNRKLSLLLEFFVHTYSIIIMILSIFDFCRSYIDAVRYVNDEYFISGSQDG